MRNTIVALGVLALVACSKDRDSDRQRGTTTTTGASTDEGVTVEEVRSTLLERRPDSREAINAVIITSEGGTVVLRGRVDDEAMRREMVDTVRAMPEVKAVSDQLQIVPQRAGQQLDDQERK